MEEPVSGGEFPQEEAAAAPEPAPVWRPAFDLERRRRRALLRRLAALLGTGTLAFTVTTWLLLRHESRAARTGPPVPASPRVDGRARDSAPAVEEAGGAALKAAREQLEALNRDDISGAYAYFSPAYRARVPLATFRRLIRAHREMFHTEEQDVTMRSQSDERVVLDIHVSADNGEDYVAHFTLARLDGRWSVDNLRWAVDEDDTHSSA
ncbi:MAG TPA: DUF4864 domain-containing protein [Candidatus Solibacter sp.]|nr:DUF4864 domain-containing protein [Candidatus Solibacter sp.]